MALLKRIRCWWRYYHWLSRDFDGHCAECGMSVMELNRNN